MSNRRRGRRGAAVLLLAPLLAVAAPAGAQPAAPRFETSFGGLWSAGYSFGVQQADESRNQTGGGPFTLFDTASEVTSGRGLEARVGVRIGRRFSLEAGGSWTTASVATRVSGDAEGAPGVVARADFNQYVIDASLMMRLTGFVSGEGRVVPFVEAGAGYLRQLYAGNALAETGAVYHAGGGLHVWLWSRPGGWLKRVGLRADGRLDVRSGGIDLGGGRRRASGAGGAGLAVQF